MNNDTRKLTCFRTSTIAFTGIPRKNLSFQNVIIPIIAIQNIILEIPETFNITFFTDHKEIYYESHGQNFAYQLGCGSICKYRFFSLKYDKLITQYNSMAVICEQMIENFGSVKIENIYNQFAQQFSTAQPYPMYTKFSQIVVI